MLRYRNGHVSCAYSFRNVTNRALITCEISLLPQEQEEAVERERGSASLRLREASERYEGAMQSQRMRLVADADLKMEGLEASRLVRGPDDVMSECLCLQKSQCLLMHRKLREPVCEFCRSRVSGISGA